MKSNLLVTAMKSNLLVTSAVTLGLLGAARAQSPDNYGPPADPHHVVLVFTLATPSELVASPFAGKDGKVVLFPTLTKCEQGKLAALDKISAEIKEKAGNKIAIVAATCFDVTEYVERIKTQSE